MDYKSLLGGKQEGAMAVMPPGSPYGGARSWDELRDAESLANTEIEATRLWDDFMAIAGNIRMSDRPVSEKTRLLKDAVAGFVDRLAKLKPGQATGSKDNGGPLAPYLADLHRLLGPRKAVNAAGMKEIAASGDPIARYLAGLVAGNVERGG